MKKVHWLEELMLKMEKFLTSSLESLRSMTSSKLYSILTLHKPLFCKVVVRDSFVNNTIDESIYISNTHVTM